MNSMESENKSYFECFAFGDSPEMADELLDLVLPERKPQQSRSYWRMSRHQTLVIYRLYSMGVANRPV